MLGVGITMSTLIPRGLASLANGARVLGAVSATTTPNLYAAPVSQQQRRNLSLHEHYRYWTSGFSLLDFLIGTFTLRQQLQVISWYLTIYLHFSLQMMADAGIPTPRFYVAETVTKATQAAKDLGGSDCVLKAQVSREYTTVSNLACCFSSIFTKRRRDISRKMETIAFELLYSKWNSKQECW